MKLGKKLMVVAMAVATLSMVGCNWNKDEHHMIDFDAPGNHAEVNFTNDTEAEYIRGWATFNTAHKEDSVLITIKNQSTTSKDGNMGFIFGQTKNDDKSYNFYVATVQWDNGKLRSYVSYYEKVDSNYLEGGYTNFVSIDGNKAKETQILKGSGENAWYEFTKENEKFSVDKEGNVKVYIDLVFDEKKGYKVDFYKVGEDNKKTGNAVKSTGYMQYGLTKKNEENKYEILDAHTGAYAMVMKGKTLSGTWDFDKDEQQLYPVVIE